MAEELLLRVVTDTSQLKALQRQLNSGALGKGGFAKSAAIASKAVLGLGTATIGVGIAATKLNAEYTQTMQQIVGLAGKSQKQVDRWGKAVLKLAPKVGKAPQELADALYFIASSGAKAADAMDILTASSKASAAGLGETKVVADAVTSVMNAYSKSHLTAAQVTDTLVATVREGKGEASDFARVIGDVVSVSSSLGVSFNDVGAALAGMTQLGTPAEKASIQLQYVFQNLLKVTPKAEKAFESVGLSSAGLRKELKDKGLMAVLNTMRKAFNGNTQAMVKAFPSIQAVRSVLSLTGDNAKNVAGVFKRMKDNTGDLDKAFEAATKGGMFKWRRMMAGLQALMVNVGGLLEPLTTKISELGINAVGSLQKLADRLGKAEGFRAKIKVIWDYGAANIGDAVKKLRQALLGGVTQGGPGGVGPEGIHVNPGLINKIGDAIAEAFARADWKKVGFAISHGILSAIDFADLLSRRVNEQNKKAGSHIDVSGLTEGLAKGIIGDRSVPDAFKHLWLLTFKFSPHGMAFTMGKVLWDSVLKGMATSVGGIAKAIAHPFIVGFGWVKQHMTSAVDWVTSKFGELKGVFVGWTLDKFNAAWDRLRGILVDIKKPFGWIWDAMKWLWAHKDISVGVHFHFPGKGALDFLRSIPGKLEHAAGKGLDVVQGGGEIGAVGKGRLQLPTTFSSTHQTAGLEGYPAVDVFGAPESVVGAPDAGTITRVSGRPWSAGWSSGPGSAIGLSLYLMTKQGQYFLTHFDRLFVGMGARVGRGTPLGTIGPMVGAQPHIHEGFRAMAEGGLVTRPTLALIGEAGPELVLPMQGGGRVPNTMIRGLSVGGSLLASIMARKPVSITQTDNAAWGKLGLGSSGALRSLVAFLSTAGTGSATSFLDKFQSFLDLKSTFWTDNPIGAPLARIIGAVAHGRAPGKGDIGSVMSVLPLGPKGARGEGVGGRVSRGLARALKSAPPRTKAWFEPPPPIGVKGTGRRPGGKTATGGQLTGTGAMGEIAATKLGFKLLHPPGQKGAFDVEWDSSGRVFEVKTSTRQSTEYKGGIRKEDRADKLAVAKANDWVPGTMQAIIDDVARQIHLYWRTGISGAHLKQQGWNYTGSVPYARGGYARGGTPGTDSVPALLSPGEFVVTGGGERMLESMTFPGVLNWLGSNQPAHFRGGGRVSGLLRRFQSGGRVGPSANQIRLAQEYGRKYGVDWRVLLAIASHETNFGRLGAGRQGYTLGVGATDSGQIAKFKGVENQYRGAAQLLAKWGATSIQSIMQGKASGYATDPGWEKGVAASYKMLATTLGKSFKDVQSAIDKAAATIPQKLASIRKLLKSIPATLQGGVSGPAAGTRAGEEFGLAPRERFAQIQRQLKSARASGDPAQMQAATKALTDFNKQLIATDKLSDRLKATRARLGELINVVGRQLPGAAVEVRNKWGELTRTMTGPQIEQALVKLRARLKEARTEAERLKILRRIEFFENLGRDLVTASGEMTASIATMRVDLASLKAAAAKLPTDTIMTQIDDWGNTLRTWTPGQIIARIKQLQALIAKGVAPAATLATWQSQVDMLKSILTDGFSSARDKTAALMQDIADKISSAGQNIVDRALRVFDAQTEQMLNAIDAGLQSQLDAINSNLQSAEAGIDATLQKNLDSVAKWQAQLTKSEAAIKRLTDAHDRMEAARSLAGARTGLASAQARLQLLQQRGASPQALREAQQAVTDAQQSLDSVLYDQQIAGLQKKADIERKARDEEAAARSKAYEEQAAAQKAALEAQAAAAEKAAQAAADAQKLELQSQRDEQRLNFELALNEMVAGWATSNKTTDEKNAELLKLMKSYGVDYKTAGDLLGSAFGYAFALQVAKYFQYVLDQAKATAAQASSIAAGGGGGGVQAPPTPGSSGGTVGKGGCFVAGTLVLVPGGAAPIETIEAGDLVLVWDFEQQKAVPAPVAKPLVHDDTERLLRLSTDRGEVTTTPEHRFWTGHAWKAAGELYPGDKLETRTGQATISYRTSKPAAGALVYNLEVDHYEHNYFAAGFLVHNAKSLQYGGIVLGREVPAILHGPEAVIPLDRLGSMGTTYVLNFNIEGAIGDPDDIGRRLAQPVRNELQRIDRRNVSLFK